MLHGMRVEIDGRWHRSARFWEDQERADAFVDRMNRGGLPAERIALQPATTYIEGAVFVPHPELPIVDGAVEAALLATRS